MLQGGVTSLELQVLQSVCVLTASPVLDDADRHDGCGVVHTVGTGGAWEQHAVLGILARLLLVGRASQLCSEVDEAGGAPIKVVLVVVVSDPQTCSQFRASYLDVVDQHGRRWLCLVGAGITSQQLLLQPLQGRRLVLHKRFNVDLELIFDCIAVLHVGLRVRMRMQSHVKPV